MDTEPLGRVSARNSDSKSRTAVADTGWRDPLNATANGLSHFTHFAVRPSCSVGASSLAEQSGHSTLGRAWSSGDLCRGAFALRRIWSQPGCVMQSESSPPQANQTPLFASPTDNVENSSPEPRTPFQRLLNWTIFLAFDVGAVLLLDDLINIFIFGLRPPCSLVALLRVFCRGCDLLGRPAAVVRNARPRTQKSHLGDWEKLPKRLDAPATRANSDRAGRRVARRGRHLFADEALSGGVEHALCDVRYPPDDRQKLRDRRRLGYQIPGSLRHWRPSEIRGS
jgi:hypothetical protein